MFQSTPSGGKATSANLDVRSYRIVSIHAFRGEGDLRANALASLPWGFNPRLPGGRRPRARRIVKPESTFQSTPSGGKATWSRRRNVIHSAVSIHAFRGEGDGKYTTQLPP